MKCFIFCDEFNLVESFIKGCEALDIFYELNEIDGKECMIVNEDDAIRLEDYVKYYRQDVDILLINEILGS